MVIKEKPAFSIGGMDYAITVNPNEDLRLNLVFFAIWYTLGITHAVSAVTGLSF